MATATAKSQLDKVTGFVMNRAAHEGRTISKHDAIRQAYDENPWLHEQRVSEFNEKYRDKSIGRR